MSAKEDFWNWYNQETPMGRWWPALKQSDVDAARGLPPVRGTGVLAVPNVQGNLDSIAAGMNAMMQYGSAYATPYTSQQQAIYNDFLTNFYAIRDRLGSMTDQLTSLQLTCNQIDSLYESTLSLNEKVNDLWNWQKGVGNARGYDPVAYMSDTSLYDLLWNTADLITSVIPLNYLQAAGQFANIAGNRTLVRVASCPMFLVDMSGADELVEVNEFYDLRDVDPRIQNPGESDVAFLLRTIPGFIWVANANSTTFAGLAQITESGQTLWYYYVPIVASAQAFLRLWDYLPSSGGALRNGITDFMKMVSLIPVQW